MKPIYLVTWVDSEASGEWTGSEDWEKGLKFSSIVSIGFLVAENDLGIALAVSWCEENKHANPIMYIPHCSIISKEEIELK